MAPWGDAKLFFCILFVTCCCTVTLAQMPMDCCLAVKNKTIDHIVIADYHRQFSGQGCSLNATILVTRRKIKLCVPADELWVHEVLRKVETRKNNCKKNKYKGNHCSGMRPV